MAYADSIRTAVASINDIASLLEGLLVTSASSGATGAGLTTTSASWGQIGSVQISLTAPAGAKAIVWGAVTVSHGTTGQSLSVQLSEDSIVTPSGYPAKFKEANGNTTGYSSTIPVLHIFTPTTGAHTYRLLWSTGAATAYCDSVSLHGLVLRA